MSIIIKKRISFFLAVLTFAPLPFLEGGSGCGSPDLPDFSLTVTVDGSGTVASSPEGIDCGADCEGSFDEGMEVVLTATPSSDFVFSGWTLGPCSGTGTCAVTMAADTAVTAVFEEFGQIVFESLQAVDASDALNANGITNVWSVNSDGTGLTPLTDYTAADTFAFNPQGSPDGSKVVYSSQGAFDGTNAPNAGMTSNIWTVNADGIGATALTQLLNASSFDPQWSPDGTKIVFDSGRALNGTDAANANNTFNIWVMNADGGNLQPLTQLTAANANAVEPEWSPDGAKIVYRSRQALDGSDAVNTNNVPNIWVVNADGSGETPLTELTGTGAFVVDPDWSPDGAKIAFRANRAVDGSNAPNTNNTFNVWVVNSDGSAETALTALTAANTFTSVAQWSPDGSKLLYHSARALDGSDAAATVSNVWVMNADGTGQTPLTRITAGAFGPSEPQWSAHGTKIVFKSGQAFDGSDTANTNNTINIWIMEPDGSSLRPLTRITAQDAHTALPQWLR